MPKPKAPKVKAPAIAVPQSREEAERLLARIGEAQRVLVEIEAEMNRLLAATKERFEGLAAPYNPAIDGDLHALHIWAAAHRDTLCPGPTKTAKLATGEVSWRFTPPAVSLRKVDEVIAELKRRRLGDFVRTKEEVDKEAILADPKRVANVPGISVGSREEFVAKPFRSEIERAEPVKAIAQPKKKGRAA